MTFGLSVGTAALIGGGLAAAGAVGGAAITANAAGNASDALQQGARDAQGIASQQYGDTVARNQPYVSAGSNALNELSKRLGIGGSGTYSGPGLEAINAQLAQLSADPANYQEGAAGDNVRNQIRALQAQLPAAQEAANYATNKTSPDFGSLLKPFTPGDLTNDPGYQFGLKQGTNTLNNSLSARGMLYSGEAGKALTQYGQDYAGTKYNDAFTRNNTEQGNIYNRLTGIAGLGQSSANNSNALGADFATTAGNNIAGGANALAAGQVATGNAFNDAISSGTNLFQNNALLQQLQNQNRSGYDSTTGQPMSLNERRVNYF